MYVSIMLRFGVVCGILPILCSSLPLRVGPHLPDAFDRGLSPNEEEYEERDELHGNEGASKYINLGRGPDMVMLNAGPARVQSDLVEAMEAAEAKRVGVAAPDMPDANAVIIESLTDKKKQTVMFDDGDDEETTIETVADDEEVEEDQEIVPAETNKAKLRTLGRMLSSTDEYDDDDSAASDGGASSSETEYDVEEAAEMWEQIGKIANKFKERSRHIRNSLSSVNDMKAAAVDLRKEVVGQLAELSVSLSETWPFSKKDALIAQLGAAKNTIQQNIDSVLLDHNLGANLHYDQDNL